MNKYTHNFKTFLFFFLLKDAWTERKNQNNAKKINTQEKKKKIKELKPRKRQHQIKKETYRNFDHKTKKYQNLSKMWRCFQNPNVDL